MIRMQIQFTEEQAQALRARAHSEGRSIAELVRQSVQADLTTPSPRPSRQELVRRASEVVGRFRSGLPDLGRNHDHYLAESFDP